MEEKKELCKTVAVYWLYLYLKLARQFIFIFF